MTFQPRVSVVVPVLNCAATIGACLDGLLAQTYPRELTEIIVVDNDSRDATPAIASQYPVTVLVEDRIHTSYAARNRGIEHATGEVVAFLDGDCVAHVEWLAHLIPPLADERVGAVLGTVDDAQPQTLCEEFTARIQPFARPLRDGLKTLLTVNVAARRSTLEALDGFDERLPTGGDVDLGWRMQRRGLTLVDAPEARVAHRHRTTFRGVHAQYRRYGFAEMLLATLHGTNARGAARHVRPMLAQGRAMASYVVSLFVRAARSVVRGIDRRYLLWPAFLLAAESGNVRGKIEGLLRTRGCRRNPFPNARLERG